MKKTLARIVLAAVLLSVPRVALAKDNADLSAGARWHVDHSVFTELPFGDGDWSYQLAYEYHEQGAYWQIAVGYAPDVSGTGKVDYVITPQLNLMAEQGVWHEGLGILSNYVREKETGASDWMNVYWQFILGFKIPVAGVTLGADAFYTFKSWGDLDEFDFDDVEYGGWVGYAF